MNGWSKSGFATTGHRLQYLEQLLSRPEGCTQQEYITATGRAIDRQIWISDLYIYAQCAGMALKRMEEPGRWQLIRSDEVS